MLKAEEIVNWDKLIRRSQDHELARKFYKKIGKPEEIKEVFKAEVREMLEGGRDISLEDRVKQKTYNPELTNEEIEQMALEQLKEDVKNNDIRSVFDKLNSDLYSRATIKKTDLKRIVKKAVSDGIEGYAPGRHPLEAAHTLAIFPDMHEMPRDVENAYAIFDDERYQSFVEPKLASKVVTLKVFHELLLGDFESASNIKKKHEKHYKERLAKQMVSCFLQNNEVEEESYPLEYLVATQRTEFRELFPEDISAQITKVNKQFDDFITKKAKDLPKNANLTLARQNIIAPYKKLALARKIADYLDQKGDIAPNEEMDKMLSCFSDEETKQEYARRKGIPSNLPSKDPKIRELERAFDEAEDDYGIISGINWMNELLTDKKYTEKIGKERIADVLNARSKKAIESGNAHIVYALAFGTNIGKGHKSQGIENFEEYVKVDRASLLESMLSELNPPEILSKRYDFTCDNLVADGARAVDDTYELYLKVSENGQLKAKKESLEKMIFLKMAMHLQDYYRAEGIKEVIKVFDNPANSKYINPSQVKTLLSKVFKEFFEDRLINGFTGKDQVSYFYTLASSKLGSLVKDNPRLEPYFKLHDFLEAK